MNKPKCPECGKNTIEVREYPDGDKLYVHKVHVAYGLRNLTGCMIVAQEGV